MKILFGVFDWGLGHATRDTPLIEELLSKGHKVDIISTGRALKFLNERFSKKCKYFDVPSVSVPYGKSRFFVARFSFMGPHMIKDLIRARKVSSKIIKEGKYDYVISDCRYDVYGEPKNSILINHQLKFKSPIFEGVLERFLSFLMKKYGLVIVPDFPERELTGELSHNSRFKGKVVYIGVLSHIRKEEIKEDIDYFFSISGPEPQRTLLEEKVLEIIANLKGNIVVAGGNPDTKVQKSHKNIKFFSFLNSKKQQEFMNRAKFIFTRSGYTTIMELAELEKRNALLVPTPGMTEQEYIADLYEKSKIFHHVHQNKLSIRDIKPFSNFNGFRPKWKTKESVKKFMALLNHK